MRSHASCDARSPLASRFHRQPVARLSKCRPSRRRPALHSRVSCSLSRRADEVSSVEGRVENVALSVERDVLRMALPSKGRMAEDTIQLLKDCQLSVYKPNPRQYIAEIPQLPELEVWFQRASDVVRKLKYGDVDLGIVGYDMFAELSGDDPDLVVLHDALDFGRCHLSLGIPMSGEYSSINTLDQLLTMGKWSEDRRWSAEKPMRVVTGYPNIAKKFFKEKGFEDYVLLGADGALEAAPAMGSADIILDLVSTGVTLRENNLKEIQGGRITNSEGILVANRNSLLNREGLLEVTKELIERFDAHLKANDFYSIVANMRGSSAKEVAKKLLGAESLTGLQGPTISEVYGRGGENGSVATEEGLYAAVICVPKKNLYSAVKELRAVGGGGILVQPMTYIFDEEPVRWTSLLDKLGLDKTELSF
ncbi:hypothetical protein BSKO_06940 [Bryopsis sp. KO-2023]|nr:hypothetical protein BSKO_06940 [Bryopsis sp. KO-2023]